MLKVGDKVALAATPNVLFGTVVDVEPYGAARAVKIESMVGESKAHTWRDAETGYPLCGSREDFDVVPYKEPTQSVFVVPISTGRFLSGDTVGVTKDGRAVLHTSYGDVALHEGDKIYKLHSKVTAQEITEEPVPVGPGYKYYASNGGGTYEVEVIAVRGDYAFIQSFKDGVPGGCTAVRISSIPKMTRHIFPSKKVLRITKEK